MHVGATLRLLRIDAGFSLRALAEQIGVSSAYLSRVENGHDPAPTPDRLIAIGRALDVPPGVLLDLARQAGAAASGYVERVPTAGALFFEIAQRNLDAAQIARIRAFIDSEVAREPGAARAHAARRSRLAPLLSPERVVLDLLCDQLADAVEVAVARADLPREIARDVRQRILAREEESPTALGGGVVVPHATRRGWPRSAVLVSLARPLSLDAPDGLPVSLAVVLVADDDARTNLALLAHIARLASLGLAGELAPLRTPARMLARLDALEAAW